MTKAIDSNITDSEWEVMRVVWAQNKTTSKDIRDIIENKKNWKPATTKTLIGRLVDKGVLNTEKDGNKYIYSTDLKESDFLKSTLEQTFNNICSKDVGKIIADLISKSTLSFRDIEELEEVLEMKKKNAVDEVQCNCVPGQCNC
ncbi:CopY/TcrY family copper transport repressor [Staphylococcus pseudintermedius]|uniref:CopY/TcrY family copper transport repressor n=3 Tax=Staphylococcaceae TaxID=90964 RepID=A0AAJ4TWH0_9STAP|nr:MULTISPECIES: CopY/TcrY family copper transport repressor [Staphylococcaceae]AYE55870.1 CopY/TcrY family copper transport repressor [Staphylococcus pseudintermedius]EGQ1305358.1 CopY/TcrY family copper transport repressor [Staphylococcus pseudintermedius]EGQ2693943.1 CopY/TcrY family copper transport repressor [Staphylococcus pseudintermedius]EGQ2702877.1 CopY/TcrY family copper transport repressor [Staphylococcus pseudintermedius]EGQ2802238.1 CopY/TcrY family copper transport repressor [St